MRWCILTVVASIAVVNLSYAENQTELSRAEFVKEVLQPISSYFQKFHSVAYEVEKTVELTDSNEGYKEFLKYLGEGTNYKYTYRTEYNEASIAAAGKDKLDQDTITSAFDGKLSYLLRSGNGELTISPSQNPDPRLSNMQGFFEPFAFLLSKENDETQAGSLRFPKMADFQSPEVWAALAEKASAIENVSFDSEDTICATFPGGIMPWRDVRTSFKVYFSKANGFPIAWERAAEDGSFRYVYRVKKIGRIKLPNADETIPFPEIAVQEKFVKQNAKPNYTATIKVKNVDLTGDTREEWIIDPTEAAFVIDHTAEKPVFISIPK
jgi:hypothetical protein